MSRLAEMNRYRITVEVDAESAEEANRKVAANLAEYKMRGPWICQLHSYLLQQLDDTGNPLWEHEHDEDCSQ